MFAWLDFEAQSCPGCGGYLQDTTSTDYVATPPHRCKKCDAVKTRQKEYQESRNPDALVVWPAEPKS